MTAQPNDKTITKFRSKQQQHLEALLDEARKRLIETGTRNRLVHTNRASKRPSTLSILHPDPEGLFDRLCNSSGGFRLLADPVATNRERTQKDGEDFFSSSEETFRKPISTSTHDTLQTRLGENSLGKKLMKFAGEAKLLEEEQGINILYLAFGFLRWFEDEKSDVLREAPLILVPVSLRRDDKRSTYALRVRDDDISVNLPLSERLSEMGVRLPEIPEADEWGANTYFDVVADAIQGHSRWSIDRVGMELGFFSFAKLLMFHDLSGDNWPEDAILAHPLLRGLMQDGFEAEEQLFPDHTRIDEKFSPSELFHVVDADASQALVIETVRAGKNMVVQGPPGTGKSQTITNIIAAAANDGKKVLFIAEKMVALNVVYDRLSKTGLGPLCLELHSRNANKKTLAKELEKTLGVHVSAPNLSTETAELTKVRDKLNSLSLSLHSAAPLNGMTAHSIVGDLVRAKGLNLPLPTVLFPGVETWSKANYAEVRTVSHRYAGLIENAGAASQHPWRGVTNLDLQPFDLDRLKQDCETFAATVEKFYKLANVAAKEISVAPARTLDQLHQFTVFLERLHSAPLDKIDLLEQLDNASADDLGHLRTVAELGQRYADMRQADGSTFGSSAFEADPSKVRSDLVRGTASFFGRWRSAYRGASAELASWLTSPLPKKAQDRVALVDRLLALMATQKALQAKIEFCSKHFGSLWLENETRFGELHSAILWVASAREIEPSISLKPAYQLIKRTAIFSQLHEKLIEWNAELEQGLSTIESVALLDLKSAFNTTARKDIAAEHLIVRLREWSQSVARYAEWADLRKSEALLRQRGLDKFADQIGSGAFTPQAALEELRQARAEALWNAARLASPILSSPDMAERTTLVETFRHLDHSRRQSVSTLIRSKHAAAMPRGAVGDMGIIRGEIARQRGHKTIRKLLGEVGRTIQEIKPVFLMSPISVAQFLKPGAVEFDLLVIDEASQVRPEEALGVIARAKQIVVVGDVKQLPPTNFFARLVSEKDDEEVEDEDNEVEETALQSAAKVAELESILTLCEARGLQSKMLRWHYRSSHPSLIEVSNEMFYDGNLVVPPSPQAERGEKGLVLRRINGMYDRGGKRTNAVEAQGIVDAIVKHAARNPEKTLGIVTFSMAQKDLVSYLLEEARRKNEALDAFVRDLAEREEVFVKNIENVQGDERDVILISVGYGPVQSGGRLSSMNFGPVSKEGGERRLNVLFTRARYRCEIFASFDPGDIDLDRSKSRGASVLKRFLTYAENGVLKPPTITGEDHDSPFEEDVARVIRQLGFGVDAQVGSAGFKIDLGVRHPEKSGQYMLAVECDGATYHGALWARERDRLRQEVLEHMGWMFYRIWSTDWFQRRTVEIARLKAALESAKSNQINETSLLRPVPQESVQVREELAAEPRLLTGSTYVVAKFAVPKSIEPHDVPPSRMAEIVARIVAIEGPIHEEEVARRVASLFGKEKAGRRIVDASKLGLTHRWRATSDIKSHNGFWFTPDQEAQCPIRDRSSTPPSLQKAAMLPPLEIQAAMLAALNENGDVAPDELFPTVARMFGFQRTGTDLRSALENGLQGLVTSKKVGEHQGWIRLI